MGAKKKQGAGMLSRTAALDATEQIMLEEGYAAVSSRKVAAGAGLTSQLLHYYFPTMDDLFIAVFQRLEERYDEQFAHAVASREPIRELWKLSMNPASANLIHEFKALATHRRSIRTMIARSAKRDRNMHVAALTRIFEQRGGGSETPSPTVLAALLASVARFLVTEKVLGVSEGHTELLAFVEDYLRQLEPPQPVKKKTRRPVS